jgi:hypothetical protein
VASGKGDLHKSESAVLPMVSRFTRVCAYDRPGVRLDGPDERDKRVAGALKALGWRVSVIWECQTLRRNEVERLLRRNVGRYPVQ